MGSRFAGEGAEKAQVSPAVVCRIMFIAKERRRCISFHKKDLTLPEVGALWTESQVSIQSRSEKALPKSRCHLASALGRVLLSERRATVKAQRS